MDISDIFPDEPAIKLTDDFNQRIDERRVKFNADRSQLNKEAVVLDIEDIKDIPNGKIRVEINGARFEGFFHKGSSKKLYVVLNGARTVGGKKVDIPIYNRWSYYAFCDHSWLSFEDPMYYDNDDVAVGWFYGTENKNYREYLAYIIEKICAFLEIQKDNVCFFGGSAGGTAAIHTAALFGSGVALSINGQINFENDHNDILNFFKCTGIDMHKKDIFDRNDIVKIIDNAPSVKFVLIENCRSRWDLMEHFNYLCMKKGIQPEYGITQFGNIVTWIYDAPGVLNNPHVAFENKNIFYAIDFLAGLVKNGEDLNKYKSLFLLINEFWYDIYNSSLKKYHVQDNEYLYPEELVQKLIWNREQKQMLMDKVESIKKIISSCE